MLVVTVLLTLDVVVTCVRHSIVYSLDLFYFCFLW